MMYYHQVGRSSYRDSIEVLENDIQHANDLAAAIPKAKAGARLQMKLVCNKLTPFLLYLLQWFDGSCSCYLPRHFIPFHILIYKVYADGRPKISTRGRKASIKDFYGLSSSSLLFFPMNTCLNLSLPVMKMQSAAVILPSLQQLHHNSMDLISSEEGNHSYKTIWNKKFGEHSAYASLESDRDDECGICLVPCTKIVLPNCCHEMCINCYRDWSTRSESCPFCRGSLRRVKSRDLWVLTCKDEVIDEETISIEDVQRFYFYIRNLPKDSPDSLFLMYYEHLI